jgi:RNA polymerase sigma-70 factor (ECF subfamily)
VNNNTGTNTTDQLLVKRVLNGDKQAFGIIVNNTENLVARIVFELIKNDGDRKDLAQDIYLKVFQKLSGFKFQSKLSTWIGQISYNTCIDHLRKRKLLLSANRMETIAGPENDALDAMNLAKGRVASPADTLAIENDISEIVKLGIEKLSPIYKTVITLYHHEELNYDEIGQITGLPSGTVKSYLFRARRELKNNLLLHYTKEELW